MGVELSMKHLVLSLALLISLLAACGDEADLPAAAPSTSAAPATTTPADDIEPAPGDVIPDSELTTSDFVGLTEDEVGALAVENGLIWRVARVDGEHMMLTEDYSERRVNVEVDGGIVTGVWLG